MVEYNVDKEGKLVTKSGLDWAEEHTRSVLSGSIDRQSISVCTDYIGIVGIHCKVCGEEFIPSNFSNSDTICSSCRETIKWLKENKTYLQRLIDKSN